jgi:hypothetical protein
VHDDYCVWLHPWSLHHGVPVVSLPGGTDSENEVWLRLDSALERLHVAAFPYSVHSMGVQCGCHCAPQDFDWFILLCSLAPLLNTHQSGLASCMMGYLL